MKSIQANLVYILGILIVLVSLQAMVSSKHRKELLEVARFHQYVGCMQVTRNNAPVCAKLVSLTPQAKIIKDVLDTSDDDGKLIIEQSKKFDEIMKQQQSEGKPVWN